MTDLSWTRGATPGQCLMLVATGRAPMVDGIGLDRAGVEFDRRTGIDVPNRKA